MSIDERLEALTMNLELLSHATEENTRNIADLNASIAKLVAVTNVDASNIRTLAGIVQSHENRISRLE
jgi:hypothetical protein